MRFKGRSRYAYGSRTANRIDASTVGICAASILAAAYLLHLAGAIPDKSAAAASMGAQSDAAVEARPTAILPVEAAESASGEFAPMLTRSEMRARWRPKSVPRLHTNLNGAITCAMDDTGECMRHRGRHSWH